MKNAKRATHWYLAALPVIACLAAGCADDAHRDPTTGAPTVSPAVGTPATGAAAETTTQKLIGQIEAESSLHVVIEPGATASETENIDSTLNEFLTMLRERKPDLQGYTSIFLPKHSEFLTLQPERIVYENLTRDDGAFLVIELGHSAGDVREALRYLPRELTQMTKENEQLKTEIESSLGIKIDTSLTPPASTKWALRQIKDYALSSLNAQKMLRGFQSILLCNKYDVIADSTTRRKYSFGNSYIAEIDATNKNSDQFREFFNVKVSAALEKFSDLHHRLFVLTVNHHFNIDSVYGTASEIEHVITSLEAESKRKDNGLDRITKLYLIPFQNHLNVNSTLFHTYYYLTLAAREPKQILEMQTLLASLRNNASVSCKAPNTSCY